MIKKSWLYWYLASMPPQARYIYTMIILMLILYGWYAYIYSPLHAQRMAMFFASTETPHLTKNSDQSVISINDISKIISDNILLYPHLIKDFSQEAGSNKVRILAEGKFEQVISFFGSLTETIDPSLFVSLKGEKISENKIRMEWYVEMHK
jgi:hypothetical protein